MNKKTLTALIIAAVVVVGGSVSFALVKSNNDKKTAEHAAMMKKDEAAKMAKEKDETVDKSMSKEDAAMEKAKEGAAMSKGTYTDYDAAKLANAEHGKVVLFFHAPWCPTCKEADKNFTSSTPFDGLTLLKTDYDSSTDLKKKYGITYQHTFVQVDRDGKLIKKWSGSTSYDDIKSQLQ